MNNRLIEAINFLKDNRVIFNDSDFAEVLGKNKGYISEVKNGKRTMGSRFCKSVEDAFPQINGDWLLTGEGEMLKREEKEEKKTNEDEALYYVPVLPVSAQGGSLNDYVESIRESECERIPSPIKGADWAITVDGDSMFPKHPNGSIVLIKKVYETAFIQWGESFVLDTCNGVVVKRLYPSEHKGYIKCVSINPDFPPFEVDGESIYGVYKVVMTMTKN